MKNISMFFLFVLSASLSATEWDTLNKEKSQTLEQHCVVISTMAGVIMQARQVGVPMADLMEAANTPLNLEILMDAFEKPKMSVAANKKSVENEFKSQWMLKCLKEHPAGKK